MANNLLDLISAIRLGLSVVQSHKSLRQSAVDSARMRNKHLGINQNGGLMSKTKHHERNDHMKQKSTKQSPMRPTSWLLILVILVSTIGFSSCATSAYSDFLDALNAAEATDEGDTTDATDVTDATDASDTTEASGATDATDPLGSDSKKTDSEEITQGNSNNTITITGDNTNSVTYATAKGLRSAVSIYCTFETTSGGASYWNPKPSTQTYYTTGSGVIYRIDGNGNAFIVTNHHVVYDSSSNTANGISEKIYVYLYGLESEGFAIPATYVGGSANYDLAVLYVNANEVLKEAYESGAAAAVTVGDSDALSPGQTTIAIGNPSADELGGISVTSGIVSVDSEYITMTAGTGNSEVSFRVIRTDAPVNSGNSGGGMYNDSGELIGIVNAKIASSDIENIGYALPSNVVRAVADNIIDYCYGKDCESVMRGLLGITITVSDYDTYFNIQTGLIVRAEEITVYEVTAGGLGEAILKVGDVIKSITIGDRTVSVTRQHHLIDAMLDVRVGDTVSLVIIRDGVEMTVQTSITEDCFTAY